MQRLKGYVEQIIYFNNKNGYTVLTLVCGDEEIKCTGIMNGISQGETVEVEGEKTVHKEYGDQFSVRAWHPVAPDTETEMARYLGSGAIKGVGEALAARIIEKFGPDTFRVIDEEPERLAEVRGISSRMAQSIGAQIFEKKDTRSAMLFLQKYGISNEMSVRIYKKYGQEIYTIIRENPYRLADDISGIGFRTADEIAMKIGIRRDDSFRIRSGFIYVLNEAGAEGNCYLPKEILFRKMEQLVGQAGSQMEDELENLAMEQKVMIKKRGSECRVYGPLYYYAELNCARMLKELDIHVADDNAETNAHIDGTIELLERQLTVRLDTLQRKAVKDSVRNGVFILTGGPGTGKTTTIRMLINYFVHEGLDIMLAAPTGRAAKRMTEATGYEAKTIHRLLEVSGDASDADSVLRFNRNENMPLEADVIIIDEVSMVDIFLMQSLLRAIMPGTRLILVGDMDQLPSVGPGEVLRDIIESGRFPYVYLETIFRQAGNSDIINNAHRINRGEPVALDNRSSDFFFMERDSTGVIYKHIVMMMTENIPRYYGISPYEVQVLTPMRKGDLGVEVLNGILQKYLNPPGPDKKECDGSVTFREGDKVMQTRNNYQLEWEIKGRYNTVIDRGTGVFNGDTGVIREINTAVSEVTVEYDDSKMVGYPFADLDELELAYAMTIHKSQGSEYPVVILPLLSGPQVLMNRNLLYTAVTRAKRCVVIIGSRDTVNNMIKNVSPTTRYSGLRDAVDDIYAADEDLK